jgi:hypothetical protein
MQKDNLADSGYVDVYNIQGRREAPLPDIELQRVYKELFQLFQNLDKQDLQKTKLMGTMNQTRGNGHAAELGESQITANTVEIGEPWIEWEKNTPNNSNSETGKKQVQTLKDSGDESDEIKTAEIGPLFYTEGTPRDLEARLIAENNAAEGFLMVDPKNLEEEDVLLYSD